MKRFGVYLLLLVIHGAQADAVSDAYNDAAGYGRANSGQGTAGLNNTAPASVIPGYNPNPSQSGYYGGVQGGDGNIAGQGQAVIGQNDAAQSIIKSGSTNPATKIDPDAPFITNGKAAENTADTVVNGTNSQCTDKVVSKTVFKNYSCDQDVNVIQSCARNATASGHEETTYVDNEIILDSNSLSFTDQTDALAATYRLPAGTISAVTTDFTFHPDNVGPGAYDGNYYIIANTVFGSFNVFSEGKYDQSGHYDLTAGQTFSDPTDIRFTLTTIKGRKAKLSIWQTQLLAYHFVMHIHMRQETKKWVPDISWGESCSFDKNTALASVGSTCTEPGGERQQIVNGQSYSVYSDCWQYTDNYVVASNSAGNCSALSSNASCTKVNAGCTEVDSGYCTHQQVTYQCQQTTTSSGKLCGGDYFCMNGDCEGTNGGGDSGFDTAVAKLAGLASAGENVRDDQINIKAFSGQAMSCRKAMAGFSNCCVDSGWGNSAGLANCSSEEMAIGKAKAKKVTVSVGEACAKSVLGVCIQKKQVYCVFGGKLARIIQEQGRRDQLGVGFGSGDSPDCRGITIPELQGINFDLINFADFYSDLIENQKIPDTGSMVQQVKDRIAAQVNAQSGGK